MIGGMVARSFGNSALMLSTTLMMLAPGWRWMFTITAGTLFIQADSWVFSTPSITVRHVLEHHRSAVAVGEDDLLEVRRRGDLVVGADLEALRRSVEAALRRVEARGGERGAHVLELRARRMRAASGSPGHAPRASGRR